MIERHRHLLPAAALLCALLSPAQASERTLTLDPAETTVRFTLGATLHAVEGSVRVVGGEVRFDSAGGPASGEIVVDATSAETGNDGRDQDMHRKVLESERFGRFVLRPTATVGELASSGTSRIALEGELEIHGGTHAVSLAAEVAVDGERVTATAELEIPYVAWGMKDPSKLFLRVKKVVTVEIELRGSLDPLSEEAG